MNLRRNKVRRKEPNEKKQPFFNKSVEAKSPFFAGEKPVQRKLNIGKANDPAEKEAESAAQKVMSQQVQKAEKKEEEKPVQKSEKKEEEKPVQKSEKKEEEKPVQKAEKQEEEKPVQKAEKQEEEKPVQKAEKKEEEKSVQKAEKKEEEKPVQKAEKKEEEKPVQKAEKKEDKESADRAKPTLEELLAQRKGRGTALPDDIRVEMEKKLHGHFKEVRIHTDKEAQDVCEQLHALAFTHGYDIYFNAGQYNPNAATGKELLAHELAHVVQQNG